MTRANWLGMVFGGTVLAGMTAWGAEALGAQQLVDPADLDAARIAMDEARADAQDGEAAVAQANAAVAQAAANLDHTVIRSPIDGIVIDRDVDVG